MAAVENFSGFLSIENFFNVKRPLLQILMEGLECANYAQNYICAILTIHDISNTQLYPGPPEVFQVTASSGSLPVPVTLDTHITGQGTEILFYCHTLELGTQSVDGSHQGQVQQTESSGEYQNTQPTLSCIKVSPSIASQSPSVKPVCKDHRSQE